MHIPPQSELPLSMYAPLGAEAVGRLEVMLTEMPYLAGGPSSVSRAAFFEPGGGPFGELAQSNPRPNHNFNPNHNFSPNPSPSPSPSPNPKLTLTLS